MKLLNQFKIPISEVARNISIVFSGNALASAIGFVAIIVISKNLSIKDFGTFSIVISILHLCRFIIKLGINSSTMKFASSFLGDNKKDEANEVFRLSLIIRIILTLVVSAILIIFAPFIGQLIFGDESLTIPIRFVGGGLIFTSFYNFIKVLLNTHKFFVKTALLQIIVDSGKMILIVVLVLLFELSVGNSASVFIFMPILGVIIGIFLIKDIFKLKKYHVNNLLRNLLSFTKWTMLSNIFGRIYNNAGLIILATMLGKENAGIYSLAQNLTYIFPIIIFSLSSVLLPEVSRYNNKNQYKKYLKRSVLVYVIIILVAAPFVFISKDIIIFIFGDRYSQSVVIFNWLLFSYLTKSIISVIGSALISLDKPNVLATMNLIRTLSLIIVCIIFIPKYGGLAVAFISFVIDFVSFLFLFTYSYSNINREKLY